MSKELFFSKIEYITYTRNYGTVSSILLDIKQSELSYLVFKYKKQMPAITRESSLEINGEYYNDDLSIPGKLVKSGKNNFCNSMCLDDIYELNNVFSYGVKLNKSQINELLPLCNALEFEPYRNRKMSMDDEGYIGYRDCFNVHFIGITDSYIPIMEWDMNYYYDEKYIWPTEKLYRYLIKNYFQDNKKLKDWPLSYGERSQFI